MQRRTTPEDIRWAYRLLLGREPESNLVLMEGVKKFEFTDDLVESLLSSDEYALRKIDINQLNKNK